MSRADGAEGELLMCEHLVSFSPLHNIHASVVLPYHHRYEHAGVAVALSKPQEPHEVIVFTQVT